MYILNIIHKISVMVDYGSLIQIYSIQNIDMLESTNKRPDLTMADQSETRTLTREKEGRMMMTGFQQQVR